MTAEPRVWTMVQSRSSPRAVLAWLAGRLRNRPDSEHEMVVNRLVIGPLVFIYLTVAALLDTPGVEAPFFFVISMYVSASVALALDLLRRTGVSVTRRVTTG